jgi:hypothetical protein
MAVLTMLVVTFSAGYFLSEYNFFVTLSDDKAVLQSNYQLEKENQLLLKDKFKLQNELKIEVKTSVLIKKKLSDLTLKITDLNKELNFYHGIINEPSKNSGIYFQKISITAYPVTSNKDKTSKIDFSKFSVYKLDLSVVKKIKTKSYRRGNITISFLDKKGKKFKHWQLLDSHIKVVKKLKLRFQSFKTIEAYILLNKLKIPSKIQISFIDSLRGKIGVSQELDWNFNKTDNNEAIIYERE